jgi:Raf kinase inhibitor-like YbhB/YbcL family protein
MEDPDAPGKEPFVHWIVYGMPANQTRLPPGASSAMGGSTSPANMIQGANSKGSNSYDGPEPPPGKAHRYYFELFALDAAIILPAGATKEQVVAAMNGHTLTEGILMGKYQR